MATQSFYYSNTAVSSVLGAGISNSATSLYLNTTPTGYPASYPFRLVLFPNGSVNQGQSPEVVYVTGGAGTQASPWTVTRGQDGTTAAAWSADASVQHEAAAGDFTLSRLHEGSVQADLPHGLPVTAWLGSAISVLFSQTLAAAAASVAINSISASYNHLLLVVLARCTEGVTSDYVFCTVNGDAGSNYSWWDVEGTSHTSTGSWGLLKVAGTSLASPAAGGGFVFIPAYTSSTFNKTFMGMSSGGNASTLIKSLTQGVYTPSSQVPVSSLTLTAPASSSFAIGSYFGLYGLS